MELANDVNDRKRKLRDHRCKLLLESLPLGLSFTAIVAPIAPAGQRYENDH